MSMPVRWSDGPHRSLPSGSQKNQRIGRKKGGGYGGVVDTKIAPYSGISYPPPAVFSCMENPWGWWIQKPFVFVYFSYPPPLRQNRQNLIFFPEERNCQPWGLPIPCLLPDGGTGLRMLLFGIACFHITGMVRFRCLGRRRRMSQKLFRTNLESIAGGR